MRGKTDIGDDAAEFPEGGLNGRTICGYETCALDYAKSTAPDPEKGEDRALIELVRATGGKGRLLEIGSGPGWDADWLETRGFDVRRTDATSAFVEFQTSRGKAAERLNLLSDPLGGPYDGIVAQYVLQHIERRTLPMVLKKISRAVRVGGAFLLTLREGSGETVEKGSKGGAYYVASWREVDLLALAEPLGFRLLWSRLFEDSDGRWLSAVFRKADAARRAAR